MCVCVCMRACVVQLLISVSHNSVCIPVCVHTNPGLDGASHSVDVLIFGRTDNALRQPYLILIKAVGLYLA